MKKFNEIVEEVNTPKKEGSSLRESWKKKNVQKKMVLPIEEKKEESPEVFSIPIADEEEVLEETPVQEFVSDEPAVEVVSDNSTEQPETTVVAEEVSQIVIVEETAKKTSKPRRFTPKKKFTESAVVTEVDSTSVTPEPVIAQDLEVSPTVLEGAEEVALSRSQKNSKPENMPRKKLNLAAFKKVATFLRDVTAIEDSKKFTQRMIGIALIVFFVTVGYSLFFNPGGQNEEDVASVEAISPQHQQVNPYMTEEELSMQKALNENKAINYYLLLNQAPTLIKEKGLTDKDVITLVTNLPSEGVSTYMYKEREYPASAVLTVWEVEGNLSEEENGLTKVVIETIIDHKDASYFEDTETVNSFLSEHVSQVLKKEITVRLVDKLNHLK